MESPKKTSPPHPFKIGKKYKVQVLKINLGPTNDTYSNIFKMWGSEGNKKIALYIHINVPGFQEVTMPKKQ